MTEFRLSLSRQFDGAGVRPVSAECYTAALDQFDINEQAAIASRMPAFALALADSTRVAGGLAEYLNKTEPGTRAVGLTVKRLTGRHAAGESVPVCLGDGKHPERVYGLARLNQTLDSSDGALINWKVQIDGLYIVSGHRGNGYATLFAVALAELLKDAFIGLSVGDSVEIAPHLTFLSHVDEDKHFSALIAERLAELLDASASSTPRIRDLQSVCEVRDS